MRYLSFLIVMLISFSATGQANLLEKKGGEFMYRGESYTSSELDLVYENHLESMDLYLSGLRYKEVANIIAILGIPFLVGGGIGLVSGGFSPKALGALLIVSGGIIELIALVPKGVGNWKLRKARRTFNYDMIERQGYNTDTSLSFRVTGNGLGLVYQF
jgi:hypothetical protein